MGVNLFALNQSDVTTLDLYILTGMMLSLIFLTSILDYGFEKLEHATRTPHPHYWSMLKQLYHELMLLGLISFLLIMTNALLHPQESLTLQFEFAHIWLFLIALFYILRFAHRSSHPLC